MAIWGPTAKLILTNISGYVVIHRKMLVKFNMEFGQQFYVCFCLHNYVISTPPRIQCMSGRYSVGNQSSCTLCPQGSSCPSISSHPLPCLPGSYSMTGAVNCTVCDAGHQCPDPTGQ